MTTERPNRTRNTLGALALVTLGAASFAQEPGNRAGDGIQVVTVRPVEPGSAVRDIDLAICLDTSGSMSGLIESAKQKLWAIVNDLALAKPTPHLRVALLTYGNDGHFAENGWVRVDTVLTEDLDKVSQMLFSLTTNGGTELVGRVIDRATTHLGWSSDPSALKLIVVAGNESADQDREVPFREACRRAIAGGVMVDSVYCGSPTHPDAPLWREVAKLADGHYANIDHDNGTVTITSPFDEQLTALSASVNRTYLPFGEAGRAGCTNQEAQDRNALSLNRAASASRALTKGGALYFCSWDLVDACSQEGFKLEDVKTEDLPEEMRKMTLKQKRAHIAAKKVERKGIQKRIGEVSGQRRAWVDKELERQGLDESKAFDQALRRALRRQAASKGFRWPAATPGKAPAAPPQGGTPPPVPQGSGSSGRTLGG